MYHLCITLKRGQIYSADLNPVVGSEEGGIRPVVILQNDVGNRYSPTTIVATITSKLHKNTIPTHVLLKGTNCGLEKDSVILLEQIRTIDRLRLHEYFGCLNELTLKTVDHALSISFGLKNCNI